MVNWFKKASERAIERRPDYYLRSFRQSIRTSRNILRFNGIAMIISSPIFLLISIGKADIQDAILGVGSSVLFFIAGAGAVLWSLKFGVRRQDEIVEYLERVKEKESAKDKREDTV